MLPQAGRDSQVENHLSALCFFPFFLCLLFVLFETPSPCNYVAFVVPELTCFYD